MTTNPPRVDGEMLRRSRSEGDIPASDLPRPARIRTSPTFRYSESYARSIDRASSSRTVAFEEHIRADSPTAVHRVSTSTARRLWSPPPTVTETVDNEADPATSAGDDAAILAQMQRRLSWYARTLAFFGYGRSASRARRAFVSLIWNLGWGLVQLVIIITVLTIARHNPSPTMPEFNEWAACDKPLGIWSCLWVVRVFLACALSYWSFVRDSKDFDRPQEDVEGNTRTASNTLGSGTANQRLTQRGSRAAGQGGSPASNSPLENPNLHHGRLYARLTLFSSLMTLSWFLTAHILQYSTIKTCRQSSPHIWWLTFGILCIMYIMVLEVALLGLVVFIIAPILFVFWNILLICIGRHPLQNPTIIKPEIGKLPKVAVERIPLVIYIPPPPDEVSEGPVTIPDAVYSYPPKRAQPKKPKRRFAFLMRLTSKDGKKAGINAQKDAKNVEKGVPQTWEDHWEQGDYPFVRLEGNRAACAICLMDFEEPKRIIGTSPSVGKEDVSSEKPQVDGSREEGNDEVQEILVEQQTDEEAADHLRLTDAGEGPQPLRLLTCGHVFHQTCLDPWLIDVSGRCPVCQRPVEVPEPSRRRGRGSRRQRSRRVFGEDGNATIMI